MCHAKSKIFTIPSFTEKVKPVNMVRKRRGDIKYNQMKP